MKNIALRLYGKDDLRLEEYTMPQITEDELLIEIFSDSICMSSYKAAKQGADHKRVPNNIDKNPIIIGHEFCAEVLQVGANVGGKLHVGQKVLLQPAMKGTYDAAGYSYENLGGAAKYGIIPKEYIDQNCVIPYDGDAYFAGSLAEPVSTVMGATHANYHTRQGEYIHDMDIVDGGKVALLAGAGPMGLAFIDYLLHRERHPNLFVVTDIADDRLNRAAKLLSVEDAKAHGVELIYLNTSKEADPTGKMRELTGGTGFNDVFVLAPVPAVVGQADDILAYDGCLNFFAGPTDPGFKAPFNFYDVHYNATHVVGTSGGNTDDIREAAKMSADGKINLAVLVTHIGGLDAAKETTLNLPSIPGGKKLIYTHISLPLTAIHDFGEAGKTSPMFKRLHEICQGNNGLWGYEAEKYLLENAAKISL